jgi:hypothetical protein
MTQLLAPARKPAMTTAVVNPSHDSYRRTLAESGSRRSIVAAPIRTAASAIGLTTIHVTSDAGNDASAPGWAQYDVIQSVAAQQKRATEPGTTSRPDHG